MQVSSRTSAWPAASSRAVGQLRTASPPAPTTASLRNARRGADAGSADAHIPFQLQVDERRHRPEIDLNVGVHLLRIDLPADEPLPAGADVDAGLFQRMDDRDVRV